MQTPRFLTLTHTIRKLPAREGSTCDIAIIVTRGWHWQSYFKETDLSSLATVTFNCNQRTSLLLPLLGKYCYQLNHFCSECIIYSEYPDLLRWLDLRWPSSRLKEKAAVTGNTYKITPSTSVWFLVALSPIRIENLRKQFKITLNHSPKLGSKCEYLLSWLRTCTVSLSPPTDT